MNLTKSASQDMIFAKTFLVVCWNLMCRSSNGFGVHHSHITWRGDALVIFFHHMKNDQSGSRPKDGRHIYANTFCPEICPVLTLGMFWASTAFDASSTKLFPGNNQYERFRKAFMRSLKQETVLKELERRGLNFTEIGSHSIRKGAATYCSSGTTCEPPSTAVHLRAGWTLGGVQNTYLRYEQAGDMFVGRTVCGLPYTSYKFGTLPPHFVVRTDTVTRATRLVFKGLPSELNFVGEHCLASLVFHKDWLQENLAKNHPILATPLFTTSLAMELSGSIQTGFGAEGLMKPTGLPPQVALLMQMQGLKESACETLMKLDENRNKIVADLTKEMERKAVHAGVVTFEGLEHHLRKCLEDFGVGRNVQNVQGSDEEIDEESSNHGFHFYNGTFHRVPESFRLPKCPTSHLWSLWCCGNTEERIPAFRKLLPADLPSKAQRKRFSDVKFLMKKIENEAIREV